MKRRSFVIRALISFYPRKWRVEYSNEFVGTLARLPLTTSLIWNVLRNALWQRARSAAPWKLGGLAMMLWMIFGTILNSVHPLSGPYYNHFFNFNLLIYFTVGYSTSKGTLRSASFAAGNAALIGILPEFLVLSLWTIGAIHPTVLDLTGTPNIIGNGFTDLCIRLSQGVPMRLPDKFIALPIVTILPAMFTGYIGAVAGKTISAFRGGMHRV